MEEVNLVAESLKFMLLGMGIVFLFLVILIKVLDFQGFILQKYFKDSDSTAPKTGSKASNQKSKNLKVIAAISAAIEHHNRVKG
jgi:oxaloacetate decarboxylase gamma subunit